MIASTSRREQCLGRRPDLLVRAVSYVISVINYGNPVVNLHCLEYGAARQILERETYHERICLLAESVGAATLERQDPQAPRPAEK